MHRRRAFTLIELLVVILIIAVTSAVMVPAFAGFYEKAKFEAEVRRIRDYFAVARERAVRGDTTVTVHFEHSVNQFSMTIEPLPPANDMPTAMVTASGTDLAATPEVAPYRVGDDFRIERYSVSGASGTSGDTQSDVRFNGDGTSDRAELDLLSKGGYTASLTLSPTTGRLALDVPTGPGP